MKRLFAAAVLVATASSASAAVVVLENRVAVPQGTQFDYRITIGPDEGLRAGDKLVIFDFNGYVENSIFGPTNVLGTIEFTSTPFFSMTQTDDASIPNLVFTYTGPDVRASGGPFDSLFSNGFGAISRYGLTRLDAFASVTTKNNPPATTGTALDQFGTTEVPAIPEPATWGMLIAGFGLIGAAVRRRRTGIVRLTA